METLKDILWPIVLIGGFGAFVDFLIGRTGQERAKNFLLRWWVRFDDVRWNNFGREEGLFAGRVIELWFGKKLWSSRRIAASLSALWLLSLTAFLRLVVSNTDKVEWCSYCDTTFALATGFTISIIGFCISVSLTKIITFRVAYACGAEEARNLILFLAMLIVNYIALVLSYPLSSLAKMVLLTIESGIERGGDLGLVYTVIDVATAAIYGTGFKLLMPIIIVGTLKTFAAEGFAIDQFAFDFSSCLPALARFCISIVFVGSFLLRPLVMRPTSLIWARIVESEKPVFTLILVV
jgi:hypothetical protein